MSQATVLAFWKERRIEILGVVAIAALAAVLVIGWFS